jgi:UDP-N-acetylglucosamine 2-epimerase (non-hydrolysing)
MYIVHVVGARPNFMKAGPVVAGLRRFSAVNQAIVHTGQHYDANMSDVFFEELGIPAPDINLQVGSGTHAQQTASIMTHFEAFVAENKPDLVVVYGDVNSTIAAALVCAKLLIPVAHVEAGLRSFDRAMPEEINRILTDQIADLLFTPSIDGNENLLREGIQECKIRLVGNVMIDSLVRLLPKAESHLQRDIPKQYALVTMHRPSNVDDPVFLGELLQALENIAQDLPVIFPIHPRTRQRIADFGFKLEGEGGIRFAEPLSYLSFLALQSRATVVITDSGGIQEETTYLGIPCLTMRENTERPVTVTHGTNVLVGRSMDRLCEEVKKISCGESKPYTIPPLWDGHTAERIAESIVEWLHENNPAQAGSIQSSCA